MALKLNTNQVGLGSLLKEGFRHQQGLEEAVFRNIGACKSLAEIPRTSFGPYALNKLIINYLDKLFLTNDAGTILKEVEVQHPAAKLILMASQQQDKEMGEGTNLVVLLAGELLAGAESLLRIGIKPSLIVEGYEMAYKRTLELLDALAIQSIDPKNQDSLRSAILSVIGAKQRGWESTLTNLVLGAIDVAGFNTSFESATSFNPDNVRCVKILGGSIPMSSVIAGIVLEREPLGQVHAISNAKVAVFACPINISRTEAKGTVLIKGAQDLLDFSKGEEQILKDQIKAIADAGINVVVTGDTIGELALHFIESHGMLALKVPSKFDLRRLCKAVSATPLARLGAPTEEEAGRCDRVERIEIGSTRCTVFTQGPDTRHRSRLATIILRSNTQNVLDDVERAIEDALFSVRNLCKDNRVLAGAGASEIELARQLVSYGETTPGIAQHAIKKYGEAFEAIPRVLASNAGFDSTEVLAKLYWAHSEQGGQQITAGVLVDTYDTPVGKTGILDVLSAKRSAIHLATEAALTILRIDQIIEANPSAGPRARPAGPQDSDD